MFLCLTNKQFAYSDARDDVSASLESSWDLLMHDLDGYAPDFSIKSTDTTHQVTSRIRNIHVHKISTHLITNFLIGSTLEGFVGTKWGPELRRVNTQKSVCQNLIMEQSYYEPRRIFLQANTCLDFPNMAISLGITLWWWPQAPAWQASPWEHRPSSSAPCVVPIRLSRIGQHIKDEPCAKQGALLGVFSSRFSSVSRTFLRQKFEIFEIFEI